MTRSQKEEYDKKIASALRKRLAEECRSDLPDAVPEATENDAAWLEMPLARARRRQTLRNLGRAAAVFLLVIMAGFGAVCAASSEVRAAVGNTWKQIYTRWQGELEKPEKPVPNSPAYFTQRASYTDEENDWYYEISFGRQPGLNDFATFIGIDLRHRYEEGRWSNTYQLDHNPDGTPVYMINKIQATGRWFGQGSDAEKRDRKLVNEILKKALDPQISGDPDPADYKFEVLDKDLFFDLLKKALAAAPDEWTGKERDSNLTTVILGEPEWQGGYRFQIISAIRQSGIDEVYIDVLYKTGDGFNDYVQLSDLAEEGNADASQLELFRLLQDVRAAIREKNSFTAMEAELKERKIDGIDLSRLISFLQDLERGDLSILEKYHDEPAILPWEHVIISKEEWEEHMREVNPSWFINKEKLEERARELAGTEAE